MSERWLFEVKPQKDFWLFVGFVFVIITAFVFDMIMRGKPFLAISLTIPILLIMYLLVLSPLKTRIVLSYEEIEIIAPPYARERIKKGNVKRVYLAKLKGNLKPLVRWGGTSFRSYKVGWFRLRGSKLALIVACRTDVVCFELEDRLVLLSPNDFNSFKSKLLDCSWLSN